MSGEISLAYIYAPGTVGKTQVHTAASDRGRGADAWRAAIMLGPEPARCCCKFLSRIFTGSQRKERPCVYNNRAVFPHAETLARSIGLIGTPFGVLGLHESRLFLLKPSAVSYGL